MRKRREKAKVTTTKPDAILVGDIHYRDDQPRCRLDDFWETQKRKALWLRDLWEDCGRPPVLQPGDLFHRWNSNPRVINAVLGYFPPMMTMSGNPGKHNYYTEEGLERDALFTVAIARLTGEDKWFVSLHGKEWDSPEKGTIIDFLGWGKELKETRGHFPDKSWPNKILITHRMILDSPTPFDGDNGLDFLKRMSGYDLIVTGHNHKPMVFVGGTPTEPRLLVNPGSFTRQTADETHEPRVYLWFAKTNEVMPVYVPIESEVITRDHIDEPARRDERIEAFVKRLDSETMEISLSFKLNVEEALKAANPGDKVRARVMEVVEDDDRGQATQHQAQAGLPGPKERPPGVGSRAAGEGAAGQVRT